MYETEEKVKKESMSDTGYNMKRSTENHLKHFARNIIKVLEEYSTEEENDYLFFLGLPEEDRLTVNINYKLYEQQQACYAVNKFIEQYGNIFSISRYSDGKRISPEYSEIEVKRDYFENLVINGKIFFEWNNIRIIASLFFKGDYTEVSFIYSKEYSNLIREFQNKLREFKDTHNYFKGDKIEYLTHGGLRFLKYPEIKWEDLVINQTLKNEILLNLIFPIKNEKLCKKHNVPWRRGILLAGIPGTGKTQLGKVLCNVLNGITVVWTTPKAIHNVIQVKILFDIARKFSPTLLVMEDIDFFGHDREFITNPIVGELLNQLDGSAPNDGVFILATTNRPYLLDKALADRPSRFDIKLIFEVPELQERKKMVELFSIGKTFSVDSSYIASVTNGLTGAHIKEVITYATLLTLLNKKEVVSKKFIDTGLKKVKEKLIKPSKELVQ